jgi:two-component system, chemotaxis family, sensor kinase CheA
VYLNHELQVEPTGEDASDKAAVNIVVLQADERQFGLVVDDINDTEEIVVKPLGKQVKGVKTFAGATIMGDGRVALILDALGLAQAANVVSEGRGHAVTEKEAQVSAATTQKQTMLVFECGANGRLAMDLSLVARLEEFKPEMVETSGGLQVVQYRGQIMPLIPVAELLHMAGGKNGATEAMQVVVYSEKGRSVGLVVDRILDIVEDTIVCQQPSKHDGLLGSAVIQQKVTDLLDVRSLVRASNPGLFESQAAVQEQ